MKSRIFSTDEYLKIAERARRFLNDQAGLLSPNTVKSPRAVGDALQDVLAAHFESFLGDYRSDYSAEFARRAMADMAFSDTDRNYYVIDVKTHREDTKFNMPNLTSVERLSRFYEDDANYFVLLLIKYTTDETRILVNRIDFVPIEFLDWNCLTVGALGWGQIQIANSNRIELNSNTTRKKWMLEMCDILLEFYPKEIGKIGDRITYFEKVKKRWLQKNG